MRLVSQWVRIQRQLPSGWTEARLRLTPRSEKGLARATFLLAPLAPGRSGGELRFHAVRGGTGPSAGAVQRALARLDAGRIGGTLELLGTDAPEAAPADTRPGSLVEAWDGAIAPLPPDWSDIYAEVELSSSDSLDPAAIELAPVNPSRVGTATSFRFRCARHFGYGASPGMVRRCLERLDARGIEGRLTIVHALSDTKPVGTQGPVWYVGGKVV